MITKTLYGLSKTGKIKVWSIRSKGVNIFVDYGYEGGKLQTSITTVSCKNVGRTNETSIEAQVEKEVKAMIKAQIEKNGYRENKEDLSAKTIAPMLAQKFSDRKVIYTCCVQPKLNGVRCLVTRLGEYSFMFKSRKNREYTTLSYMIPELQQVMNIGETWDGEIFNPALHFQEITSLVKKEQPDSSKLQFWIYDIVDTTQPFIFRAITLKKAFADKQLNHLVCVKTFRVDNKHILLSLHKRFVKEGFEGTIIRKLNGLYEYFRSSNLLKYKDFIDDEFEIIDSTVGTGSHEGAIIFICLTKDKRVFNVTPKMSLTVRREMALKSETFIGKKLTVKFQNLSKDGIPIFPIGLEVRDYE